MENIKLKNGEKSKFIETGLSRILKINVVEGFVSLTLLDVRGRTITKPLHKKNYEIPIDAYVQFSFEANEQAVIEYELKM